MDNGKLYPFSEDETKRGQDEEADTRLCITEAQGDFIGDWSKF